MGRKRLSRPWLTPDVMKNIKFKSESFKKFKLGLITHVENKKISNKLNSIVRSAKEKIYKSKFDRSTNDIKSTWKELRKLESFNNKKQSINSIKVDGAVFFR